MDPTWRNSADQAECSGFSQSLMLLISIISMCCIYYLNILSIFHLLLSLSPSLHGSLSLPSLMQLTSGVYWETLTPLQS